MTETGNPIGLVQKYAPKRAIVNYSKSHAAPDILLNVARSPDSRRARSDAASALVLPFGTLAPGFGALPKRARVSAGFGFEILR